MGNSKQCLGGGEAVYFLLGHDDYTQMSGKPPCLDGRDHLLPKLLPSLGSGGHGGRETVDFVASTGKGLTRVLTAPQSRLQHSDRCSDNSHLDTVPSP